MFLNFIFREMKRAEIIIKGDVQSVGYRDVVKKISRKSNIKGYVENLKQDDVKIVAEGEEENLNAFIGAVNIKKYPVNVESVEVNYKEATGEFEYFEIKRGDPQDELGERMDLAGTMLYEINNNTKMMLEKQDKMLEKQDKMLEKQDKMLEKQDKMLEKQDKMLEKQDTTVSILRDIRRDTAYIPTVHEDIDDLKVKYERMDVNIGAIKSILKVPC